jgi:ACS family glucarate transporter-like MFS transporter
MTIPKTSVALDAQTQKDAEAPSLQNSSQRWWLLLLLFTGMLISYAHRGALSVASSRISEDLHLTEASLGILLSSFSWVYAFMQMPAGWLADRFGVRRAYSLGFIFWSLMSALTGLANSFAALIGFRVALGAGQAITFPATSRAISDGFQQRERGLVTGVYLTGVRFGTALIFWVGPFFLARYDWKLFFLMTGLVPLIWLLPWWKFLQKWEGKSVADAGATPVAKSRASFFKSLALLKHRSVFGIFLGFFAYDYAWFVFINWLPRYLKKERGFTDSEMAIFSAMPFVIMSIIIVCSGILSDSLVRRGYDEAKIRKIFILTGMAICCLIVPAGLVADKMTAVWLLTISLSGLGIASPNTWTLTQTVCNKKIVGTVAGIQNFGGNLGGIIAPALTGFIAHLHSFALALGVVGVVLVIGMLAYWFLISDQVDLQSPEPVA